MTVAKIKGMTKYPPNGTDLLCPRCDWLYKQLMSDSFCLRCWNTHVNVAVSYVELIKFGEWGIGYRQYPTRR